MSLSASIILLLPILMGIVLKLLVLKKQNHSLQQTVNELTQQLQSKEEVNEEKSVFEHNLDSLFMFTHEFKKPLAVVDSGIQLLQQRGYLQQQGYLQHQNSPINELLVRMGHATHKLLHLFESTLIEQRTTQEIICMRQQNVNITHLISIVVDYQRQTFDNHMLILRSHVDANIEMRLDPDLINIALSNVIDNACKYSNDEQPVTITVHKQLQCSPDKLKITVLDKGQGIAEQDFAMIFDEHFRASNASNGEGQGVGLFLVKRIIEMHGGTIDIKSEKGVQTLVTIELPIVVGAE